MRETQMLLGLGMSVPEKKDGLATPFIVGMRERVEPSAMIETPQEIAEFHDSNTTVAERAFPGRSPGAAWI